MYFVMDYLRTFSSQEYRKNIISQKKKFSYRRSEKFSKQNTKDPKLIGHLAQFFKVLPC